ncbi:MAG TPA: UPF0146 family protein [Methanocorpusculum sp.]|nr:UPF0146 family protein [Methanocorpusculum sp.]
MAYEIERAIGEYIKNHYASAVEIGFGGKTVAAEILQSAGIPILCTDVHCYNTNVPSVVDDCVVPDLSLYRGAEVIYGIRPGLEIIPAMIFLARSVHADLLVYHLGFELYQDGGEVIDLGPCMLHKYV